MRRFVGDLFKLINEAPVTDIAALGDFSKPGGFTHAADKALVSTPDRLELIKKAWGKSASDFHLYFANFRGGKKFREYGVLSDEHLAELEKILGKKFPLHGDFITIIFTNNSGDKWQAMTPWIIAHRVAHALRASAIDDRGIKSAFLEFENAVGGYLDQLAELHNVNLTHFKSKDEDKYSSFGNGLARDNMHRAMAHAYGSMRSARTHKLRSNFEFNYETIAQYLITGRVNLDKDHRPVVMSYIWGRPQTKSLPADRAEEAEMIKRDFSMEIPHYIDNVLAHATGKVLSM